CQRVVDNGHTWLGQRVALCEFAAGDDGDSHGSEVAVGDDSQLLFRLIFRGFPLASRDVKRAAAAETTERQRIGGGDATHAGTAPQAGEEFVEERLARLVTP